MNVKDYKSGVGFIVEGISFGGLCDCLAEQSGVTFADRRRFFWSAEDIRVEFVFRGHTFRIETWDVDDSIFVFPKDEEADLPEIAELRDHVARLCLPSPKARSDFQGRIPVFASHASVSPEWQSSLMTHILRHRFWFAARSSRLVQSDRNL